MKTQEEMKQRYDKLYKHMATSGNVENMKIFGRVTTEMMDWLIANKPEAAREWIEELEMVLWDNYLAPKEADSITDAMVPKRPWPRDQWKIEMERHGYMLEEEPYYNRCALYVTMCMIGSDDAETLKEYARDGVDMFAFIHALALNKLKDKDGVYSVRKYFDV